MSDLDREFTDELISAYLDGELSDQDRERVERVLESEPRYRRMLDELQTLRESLQSLPRFQLDEAFHQRVMRRALDQTHERQPGSVSNNEVRNLWRRVLWTSLTIAAGLLLIVFFSDAFWRREVAMHDGAPVERAERELLEERVADAAGKPSSATATGQMAEGLMAENLAASDAAADASAADASPGGSRGRVQPTADEAVELNREAWGRRPLSRPKDQDFAAPIRRGDESTDDLRGAFERSRTQESREQDGAGGGPEFTASLDAVVYLTEVPKQVEQQLAYSRQPLPRYGFADKTAPNERMSRESFRAEVNSSTHFLLVKGSPEQIGTWFVQMGSQPRHSKLDIAPAPDAVDSSDDRFKEQADWHAPIAQGDADRLAEIQTSDVYIDLDASTAGEAEVTQVASDSHEYRQLVSSLFANDQLSFAKGIQLNGANAASTVGEPASTPLGAQLAAPVADAPENELSDLASRRKALAGGAEVQREQRTAAARAEAEPTTDGLAKSPGRRENIGPSLPVDSANVRGGVRVIPSLRFAGQSIDQPGATPYYYQAKVPVDVRQQRVNSRMIVDQLRQLSPQDSSGPLQVLFVIQDEGHQPPLPAAANQSP